MKRLMILSIVSMMAFMSVGCGTVENTTASMEQARTEKNQRVLLKTQPPMQLAWSLERENINKRTELWNDPNKVSYIYLVDFGKIMAFYPIKGKVSSVNSQITNPDQMVEEYPNLLHSDKHVLASPAEDGSYGTNGDGIFFFTTDGTYVEWAGTYMLCDKPLQMATPPALVRTIK